MQVRHILNTFVSAISTYSLIYVLFLHAPPELNACNETINQKNKLKLVISAVVMPKRFLYKFIDLALKIIENRKY